MGSEKQPVNILMILDGWGINASEEGNAVAAANTPFLDTLLAEYPSTTLKCSGEAVGLPDGTMGNSEVGHMNLGAGRIVYQDYTRISKAVQEGTLGDNAALVEAIDAAAGQGRAVHLLGLLSPGGVHSHELHLIG